MTEEQAYRLLDYTQTANLRASCRQIGNGEWIVILDGPWFIWSFSDFSAYVKAYKKDQARQRQAQQKKQEVKSA